MSVTLTVPADLPGGPAVWAVEIGQSAPPSRATPRGGFVPGLHGGGFPGNPAPAPSPLRPIVRFSDAGLIFEPGDASRPNQAFPARLAEPVALEEIVPVVPEGRRVAATFGDLVLHNADRRMDALGGDWRVAGQPVAVLRGPRRVPLAAPASAFVTVATARARQAGYGTDRLRVPLDGAAADLDVPCCATYAGTGGAEGPAALAGRFKPRLYGEVLSAEPVLVADAQRIYQLHDGAMSAVLAVRDAGVALTPGANFATYGDLATATVAAGTYATCLAQGFVRLGAVPVGVVTVDARGDTSLTGYSASAAGIAERLLRGPGAIAAGRVGAGFSTWPTGAQGYLFAGGTVADALEAVAASVAGWVSADRFGNFTAGSSARAPEGLTPVATIAQLRAPAQQAELGPPRWRQRVAWGARQRPLAASEFAGAVVLAQRDAQGAAALFATWFDAAILAATPGARDAEPVPGRFVAQADAQALANALGAAHGPGRSLWQLPLGRWTDLRCGDAVRVDSPLAPRLAGRTCVVRRVSHRGEQTDVTVWG